MGGGGPRGPPLPGEDTGLDDVFERQKREDVVDHSVRQGADEIPRLEGEGGGRFPWVQSGRSSEDLRWMAPWTLVSAMELNF